MPPLPNPKREAFAQALASGATRRQAMLTAGYRYHNSNACTLAAKPDVKERVAELLAAKANETTCSLASLMAEMAATQATAMADQRLSRALAALVARARLAGLWPSGSRRNTAKLGRGDRARYAIKRAMRVVR